MIRYHWLVAMVIAVAALPALAVAQDAGTVAGTVVEATTQRPLPGVQVTIVGTRLGTLTNQEGRFLITNVPAGTQEVRATLIGYARGSETVTVAPGATATVNLTIRETAIELEGIVVNPITGREERRREPVSAQHLPQHVFAQDGHEALPLEAQDLAPFRAGFASPPPHQPCQRQAATVELPSAREGVRPCLRALWEARRVVAAPRPCLPWGADRPLQLLASLWGRRSRMPWLGGGQ
jgi:hypothetical protein